MPQRRYRRRKRDSSIEEEGEEKGEETLEDPREDVSMKLEETKELQRFRKRPVGVSAVGLAFGKKFTEEEKFAPDPFKLKTGGGLVDLKNLKPSELEGADDEVLQRLSSTFSAETKACDDETHMLQYIEEEMEKKKGPSKQDDQISTYDAKINALYELPDRLKVKEKEQSEEMLSNQMLSGIPEVNLGLEAKFRNIEETELARQQMIEEQKQKRREKESLASKNMATNFTLHSLRFYKADRTHSSTKSKENPSNQQSQQPAFIPVVGESEPELKATGTAMEAHKRKLDHTQMATDDYHYDKFKKKARRF